MYSRSHERRISISQAYLRTYSRGIARVIWNTQPLETIPAPHITHCCNIPFVSEGHCVVSQLCIFPDFRPSTIFLKTPGYGNIKEIVQVGLKLFGSLLALTVGIIFICKTVCAVIIGGTTLP